MNEWFDDDFKHLQVAFAKRNIILDSPSKDGFLRCFSANGRRVFFTADALPLNCASARSLAHDKLATYQALIEEGVTVPKGIAFFASEFHSRQTKIEPQLLLENLNVAIPKYFPGLGDADFKLVVKPGQGARGYMVNVCKTLFEIQLCAKNILAACHYGIIQEYTEGPEYRVVILDDKPIVIYKKCESPFETTKNNNPVRGDIGISVSLTKAPPEIIKIAIKAHRAIGLRYSGVDVCLPWNASTATILEVNSSPGFDALENDPDFDAQEVADIIAEAVLVA